MSTLKLLICLLVTLSLANCINKPQASSPTVQHIVVVWLKEPSNEQHRQQLLKSSQQLTAIPGILSVRGGTVIPSKRTVVDSGFDVVLIMEMRDREVLSSYVQHPLHKKLLREIFNPLIEHYQVYDVELPSF